MIVFAEDNNIPDAMRRGFLEIDEDMLDDDDMKDELAGTTAICVIIKDKKIYCVSSQFYNFASRSGTGLRLSFEDSFMFT